MVGQSFDRQVVAAFDFDGTITTHDSLISFVIFIYGPIKTTVIFASMLPFFIKMLFGFTTRLQIKEEILSRFFKGLAMDDLCAQGDLYAKTCLNKIVRPKAFKGIEWHQKQGHKCLLISASIDVYLRPWAKKMGFDAVISSELEIDQYHLITGRLKGKNCRGKEKVRRLLEMEGDKQGFYLYAYGDSQGDKELLALADSAHYRPWR